VNALILAAGRGSRLGALTDDCPKCLVRLGGRTLLEWQVEALRGAGVSRIAAVRGYQANKITAPDLLTFDNPRWAEANMVVSLRCAADWLAAEPCIVSYGDIVYPASTVITLAQSLSDLAIAYDVNWRSLWEARFDDPLTDAETFTLDAHGCLESIGLRPATLSEVQGQYIGLIKFTPAGWARVNRHLASQPPETVDRLDMTSLLRRLLADGMSIDAVPISDRWFEVDTARDLELYESTLRAD
jgi:choline kinase